MTTDDQQDDTPEPSRLREMLEQANARAAEAEAKAQAAERREVFREAGFDLANQGHAAMIRGYDGDLAPDSVKAFADSVGIGSTPPTPEAPVVPTDEREALQRIAEAARDGSGGNPPPMPDRAVQLEKEMDAAYARRDIQEMDRLSVEYAKALGTPVVERWTSPS